MLFLPGAVSVYQMDFPVASDKNYVIMKDVDVNDEITVFSVSFWAKFLCTYCSVFVYSSPHHHDEIGVFLYRNFVLDLSVKSLWTDDGLVMNDFVLFLLQWPCTTKYYTCMQHPSPFIQANNPRG